MSVTNISLTNRYILWGKSAGRCQFRGCNKTLFLDALTKSEFNQAYIAHIVGDVPNGPRGDVFRSPLLKDDINNLMLMCDVHHRKIDANNGKDYTENELLEMKKEHEERIERVTAIAPNMQSYILTYRANVGVHTREISYQTVNQYLQPEYYPAISDTIDLSLSNSVECDKDDSFWQNEVANLEKQFNRKLHQSFSKGEIKHLSVFAFAPIPLLVKLGTLINDIYLTDFYQPVRNPTTWKLTNDPATITYKVIPPLVKNKVVALNVSLSATINNERITSILGDDCAIYTLTIDAPFNDFLKSKKELEGFSQTMRKLFNQIKAEYDEKTPIHIFPAMPIATAIELGRVCMPKADIPMWLYDQNTSNSGFSKVLSISNK